LFTELDGHVSSLSVQNEVEASFEEQENQKMIDSLLNQLDDRSKEVVQLFYLKELRIDEVAEIMDLNPNNVKILLYRARKKLSEYFSMNNVTSIAE
jgi:RNA polymerase sigma-70 factor (ECF subfamily)